MLYVEYAWELWSWGVFCFVIVYIATVYLGNYCLKITYLCIYSKVSVQRSNQNQSVRYKALGIVTVRIPVFWDVLPCYLVDYLALFMRGNLEDGDCMFFQNISKLLPDYYVPGNSNLCKLICVWNKLFHNILCLQN